MKIGILTFHNAINFGAFLQAYALQNHLESKGHIVEVIDYRNEAVELDYKCLSITSMPKRNPIKTYKYLSSNIYRAYKYRQFRDVVSKHLKVSKRVYNTSDKLLDKYDVIVIGSDQLWNVKFTGKLDEFYFGEFSANIRGKIITYAVCMNTDHVNEDETNRIKQQLNNFTALSVRENSLKKYLTNLTHKDIFVTLDPTLLIDKSFWSGHIKDIHHGEDYICVYAILKTKEVISFAEKMARETGLKLIVMSPAAEVYTFNNSYGSSDPFDFISTIANAKYVVTSSFHGLAFSLIFEREVLVLGDDGRNERMVDLLNIAGIPERFLKWDKLEYSSLKPIDYHNVNQRLKRYREDSDKFLIENLK